METQIIYFDHLANETTPEKASHYTANKFIKGEWVCIIELMPVGTPYVIAWSLNREYKRISVHYKLSI
jgi:hypothetical protein